MEKIEIDRLMQDLHFSGDQQKQADAKKKLIEQVAELDIEYFLNGPKSCWHNQIEVFEHASDDQIKTAIDSFLRRFQDLNWPGTDEIMQLLLSRVPHEFLVMQIENACRKAIALADDEWVYGLAGFMAVGKISFESISDDFVRAKLKKAWGDS